nr:hypothetical protein [Tanacetum cinerariifolium]
PPMLDRIDFASWQQHIRLYHRGKENGVNILKFIDEGPFQMGTFRETLAEGNEDIYTIINHYTNAKDIWDNLKMLLEGSELTKEDCESQLYDDFEHFHQHKGETIHDYYAWVVVQNVQGRQNRIQGNNARGAGHIARNCTQPKRPQNSEYFNDKMLLMQAQENGVALDEEQLLFIACGQENAVDEDVDEQPVQDLALNVDNVF